MQKIADGDYKVSILARLLSRALPATPTLPAPAKQCFNPRPAAEPGATIPPASHIYRLRYVSILARLLSRALLEEYGFVTRASGMFQSSPGY